MKVNTWLPVFTGFYGTIFDSDSQDDFIQQDISDYCYENKLSNNVKEKLNDEVFSSNEFSTGYKDYQDRVCKSVTATIEQELKELKVVKSIKMERLVSPREYNFSNDSINIEVVFTKKNIKEIKNIISDNMDKWRDYLKDHYSSYDGFMSFQDNYPESGEWQIDNIFKKGFKNQFTNTGAILNFICEINDIDEMVLIENNVDNNYLYINMESLMKEYLTLKKIFNEKEKKFK